MHSAVVQSPSASSPNLGRNVWVPIYKTFNFYNNIDLLQEQNKKIVNRSFIEIMNNYYATSSLHGLKYAGDPKLSKGERLFWLIAFIIALVFACYFIAKIYEKYDHTPVIISFNPKMVKLEEIPFPAVTICNVNIALKTKAERINKNGSSLEKQLLADFCNSNSSFDDQSEGELNWDTMREMIINMNQKCGEMFHYCQWETKVVNCNEVIQTILTDEGYCCSFNRLPSNYSLKDIEDDFLPNKYPKSLTDWNAEDGYPSIIDETTYPYRSLGSGQHFGLTLVLDANLDEYFCSTTSSIGFKALLSSPIENPKIADIGTLIAPSIETRILIDVDIQDATRGLENIHYEKRQCFFARERSLRFFRIYTEMNCKLECEGNYTQQHCGCVPYYLPRDKYSKICDKKDEICAEDARFIIERFSPQRLQCNCLPACHEINYSQKSLSMGRLISGSKIREEYLNNVTVKYFTENMAIVHFYFPKDKFQKRTKGELYGFSEFLSNTGGLLGLFLGFSFLSAVEVFYFFIVHSMCDLWKSRSNNRIRKNSSVPFNN